MTSMRLISAACLLAFTAHAPWAHARQGSIDEPARASAPSKTGKTLDGLMVGCRRAARRDFLASMVLVDGRLASADFNAPKRCLKPDRYAALLAFFQINDGTLSDHFCSRAAGSCQPRVTKNCSTKWCGRLPAIVAGDAFLSIEDAVARCSRKIRDEYLDGLVFVDGRLAKAAAAPACE